MKIDVLLFASLAKRVGQRQVTLDLPDSATASDVLKQFVDQYINAAASPESTQNIDPATLAIAINMEYVSADHPVQEGDEVALIPPVSGG